MNKLPDTTFTVDNATEVAWILDKLKEQGIDVSRVSKYIHVEIGFIYYYDNYVGFDYKTTQTACHTFKSYNVSELMTPLQDGAYQIEDSAGKEWLEFLLLKFLLQGVMELSEYTQALDYLPKIRQLRKGNYRGSVGNKSGWDMRADFDYEIPKIYQHTVSEVVTTHQLLNQKYLVKVDSEYKEVYIVPNTKTPNSNPELVRVVDLVGEQFYWAYRKDLYSNNVGDLK